MRKRLAALVVAVLGLSLVVVHARQESRRLYSEHQKLTQERDALNVEWGQLLLEEGAWSQHRRVETTARTRLGMELPSATQIVVVRLREEQP
jgi:cell division protein FtsL